MFDSFKKLWRWDNIPKSFWYLLFKKVVLLLTYYNDIDFSDIYYASLSYYLTFNQCKG